MSKRAAAHGASGGRLQGCVDYIQRRKMVELDELAGWWIEGDGAKKSRSLAGGLLQARAMLKNSNHKMLKLRGARVIRNTAERNSADAARAEFRAERPPRFFCADCDECFQRRLELQKHCKLANAKPDKESGEKHNAHQLFRFKRLKGDKEAQAILKAQEKVAKLTAGKVKASRYEKTKKALEKIRDKHKGTAAERDARAAIERLKASRRR